VAAGLLRSFDPKESATIMRYTLQRSNSFLQIEGGVFLSGAQPEYRWFCRIALNRSRRPIQGVVVLLISLHHGFILTPPCFCYSIGAITGLLWPADQLDHALRSGFRFISAKLDSRPTPGRAEVSLLLAAWRPAGTQ